MTSPRPEERHTSAIDEVIAALHKAIDELSEATTATNDAAAKAADAVARADALGTTAMAAGLSAIKERIGRLSDQTQGMADAANSIVTQVCAIADDAWNETDMVPQAEAGDSGHDPEWWGTGVIVGLTSAVGILLSTFASDYLPSWVNGLIFTVLAVNAVVTGRRAWRARKRSLHGE